jgi:hypothetical protein
MATAKVLHPCFERSLPWRAAIAPLRVRETDNENSECRALEKRGARRSLSHSHGNAEFARELFFILRSMKKEHNILESKHVPSKFLRSRQGAQDFLHAENRLFSMYFSRNNFDFTKRTNGVDI